MEQIKKDFCKILERLSARHSLWTVWNDFLHMSAISMANAIPGASEEKAEREAYYMSTVKKYDSKELDEIVRLFTLVVIALERNPEQDFLGEMYHRLNLQQHQKGQFFTPYHISHFMAEINAEGVEDVIAEKGFVSVSDSACGAGAMLVAYANVLRSKGINYQTQALLVAQDIDRTAALMCYIQLCLCGCSGCVIIGDSLLRPGFHPDNDIWFTPLFYLNQYRFRSFFKAGEDKKEELPVIVSEKTETEHTIDVDAAKKPKKVPKQASKDVKADVILKPTRLDKCGQQRLSFYSSLFEEG